MKIRVFLSLLLAGSIVAGAQTQGYKDGIEYYKAGQYDNAKTILERTINDPATDQSLAYYYLGQVNLAKGDKAAAKANFEKGLSLNADNAYNYVGLGAVALLDKDSKVAEENFKTAQKLAKKNADLIVAVARAYYNADPVAFTEDINKLLAKAHNNSKDKEPAIYVLEGDMKYDSQDYGGAAQQYEQAITFDPNNSEGYVKFANAYFYVNRDFAIQKLEELLAKQPQSAMAQRELAEKYFKADHWRKASDLYGKYIQNPNHFPEDKARYAVLLYWGEKYPESLAVANEILASDPGNFLMQRVRFLDQTAMKDFATAVASAEKFFADNAGGNFTTNDYVTYAEALTGNGQDSLAVVQYELAAKRDPDNGELLKNLSSVYSNNKQYGKSAEAYDAYLKLQEKPSLNDLFDMSRRYLNAAASETDTIQARELALRGLEYVNQVIDRTSEVQPVMYQRKAFLEIAGNNKRPNAAAVEALDKMLELLDKDPANLDPANPRNNLNLYSQAYAFKQAYASIIDDDDAVQKWGERYKAIKELMTPKQ